MANTSVFPDFFEDIGNVVKGVWNDWTGNTANRENIAYQKEYNEQVFNRADTQYQRTVADLRAAGLSSQLAAGSPSTVAGASQAPSRTVGNESAAIERLVSLVNAIKQTDANVNVASSEVAKNNAQARDAAASATLKGLEAGSYGERLAVDLAVQRAQENYYIANTGLVQKQGEYYAEFVQSQIQSNLSQSRHNDKLCDLVEKQILKTDREALYVNKQIEMLSEQISSEILKQSVYSSESKYYDAQTEYLVQNTVNAALQYVVEDAAYQYAMERGDSPKASQVSSTQAAENKKEFKRGVALKFIGIATSGLGAIGAGIGFNFGGSVGRKIRNKFLGDDTGLHNFGF